MVRKCLILRHCIVEIAKSLNFKRNSLPVLDHIESLYEWLFQFFLLLQFLSVHRHKAIQYSRMAGNHPICSKFNDSRVILRSADLLRPFLIAVRKAVIIVFVAQGIRQNIAHTFHAVLPHHLIDCTIAKVHSIIIVRNRFMDCLLALAVQPIGSAV